jgi:hypothetical protein
MMIHISNGQVVPAEDTVALNAAIEQTMVDAASSVNIPGLSRLFPDGNTGAEFAAMSPEPLPHNNSSTIEPEVIKINTTFSDTDESSSATYDLETQRQPEIGVIDIIGLSEQYILG